MHWIILGIVALALVAISVRYPRLAFTILIALLGGAVLLLQIIPGERERASAQISVSDVELLMVNIAPSYANSFELNGRLGNHSSDVELSETTLEVRLRDCSSDSERTTDNCQVLGVAHPRVTLLVPPGQSRDFSISVNFPRVQVHGETDWDTAVSTVRGYRLSGAQ